MRNTLPIGLRRPSLPTSVNAYETKDGRHWIYTREGQRWEVTVHPLDRGSAPQPLAGQFFRTRTEAVFALAAAIAPARPSALQELMA